VDFDLHGRPPFVPPPLLELDEWPPCSLGLDLHQLHLFTNFATKAKRANPPNLAKPKPKKDQFLLQPNFSHLIFYAFITIPHQDCTRTTTSLIHQFCYEGKKSQFTELG